ncbi:hypothetical protein NG895_02120 [Aeoliella sp. ICT_H6.2]|uniref:Uncharacterized protein n=1 Tax=Aeoliella straminimaris TaxID=2954799 RepID=A0A9X2F5N4_9BACT|nr:hypothetical protein [Aeoliella straminimaris]MCO6042692.1 hypothetical protein [Aeoliella straminimaris]
MTRSDDTTENRICYKVWLEIERHDELTDASETLDAPGGALAKFATYDEAYAFATAVTNAHATTSLRRCMQLSVAQGQAGAFPQDPRAAEWMRPYPIASVTKNDLLIRFSREEIDGLDYRDLEKLARRMADAYIQRSFWEDLESFVRELLEEHGKTCFAEED